MKIGLDLRFIRNNDLYSDFVLELVNKLIIKNIRIKFTIYTNDKLEIIDSLNVVINKVDTKTGSFKEQTKFLRKLNQDDNNSVIFFSYNKPILYKKDYFLFVASLKDIYYQNFESTTQKYVYLFTLQNSLKNAVNIFCFDQNTKDELIERMNLAENKISIINGFFPNKELEKSEVDLKIDIKTANKINNDFILYSGGSGIEKNLDRLIPVFGKINSGQKKLDLVFMGNNIAKNISLRNLVIKNKLQEHIHFLGPIKEKERPLYYQEAVGVIFPSLYEPFPFKLNEAVKYNSRIIASNIDNIKNMFGDNISYFSPISGTDILEHLKEFLKSSETPDYGKVLKNYNIDSTMASIIKMIN